MSRHDAPVGPFDVLVDYERRSLAHVAGLPEQIDAPGLWRGIGYRLGPHYLASSISDIIEIITLPPLTPVPGGQPWLLGVSNVRGTLLPVVDLKQFLDGERTVMHETTRALIIRQPGGNVAMLIDELLGQRNFTREQEIEFETPPQGRYATFVQRAFRLGDVVWSVFNLGQLARTPEFRQAAVA